MNITNGIDIIVICIELWRAYYQKNNAAAFDDAIEIVFSFVCVMVSSVPTFRGCQIINHH